MRRSALATIVITLGLTTPVPAVAQRIATGRAGVSRVMAPLGRAPFVTPPSAAFSPDAGPPRLPFVLAGAVIGGVTAGLWYAHQVSKTDDAMIDLSVPVVAIGTGVGAFGGFLVGEVVRAARSP